MRFTCVCGNVLRDQTDYIPYKAWFAADQDLEEIAREVGARAAKDDDPADLGDHIYSALFPRLHTLYQCYNCGRVFVDDPDDPTAFQIFRPENSAWKKVLASRKAGVRKRWPRNLVGHWDAVRKTGELWFDPASGETGGYETFDDRTKLECRYHELFKAMRAEGTLMGARLGVGSDGGNTVDVHSWSARGTTSD
jgi:hypothetical protein